MFITDTKQFLIDSVENLRPLCIMDIKRAERYDINQRNFVRYRAELSLRLLKKYNENIYCISH